MSDGEDLGRRLQAMAAEPAPPVDPAFADQLDTRLRVLHAEHHGTNRGRPVWIPAVLGSLAVSVLALMVVGVMTLGRSSEAAVVLTAASNTDVIFPGAGATAASAGLLLTDGTRIVVGVDGEAVVNGVVLGPGSEALVVGDQIDVVVTVLEVSDIEGRDGNGDRAPDGTMTVTTAGRSSTIDQGRTNPGASGATDRDRPGDSSSDGGAVTTATTADPASTTSSPGTTATTDPPRTTRATDGATTSTTAGQPPDPLELTVTPTDRSRLRLAWALNRELAGLASWRVVVGHGDRVTPVVAIRDEAARRTTIERSVAAGGSLWVEALDVDGNVLLESTPVDIPDS